MTTLDARGLACPLPLTMAKRRMADLGPGETLVVLATDPEAPIDLAAWAARVHYEGRVVEAEPGIDEAGLVALEREGWKVQRFSTRNLYFGGVQAAARDPDTGALSGGGDPRRDGAAVVVE